MLVLLSWVLARKPKKRIFVPNREEFQTVAQKKLILISLDWTRPKDPPLSLGHASILASLRHHNIDVFPRSWSVNVPNFSPDDVVEFIMIHANSCIDVAFVWNEKAVQHILRKLKKYKFPGKVILGGPQVSYVKKGIEEYYPYADIYIRVHYFRRPDLGLSAASELDVLPSPFLTKLIPPQQSDVTMKRHQFPVSRIIQEAEWIAKHSNIQYVACRIEMVKEEFLNKVVELNDTAETVLEFERNIKIEVSLIFGLPGQTITTFKKSIDFCFNHKVPVIHAFPLMLLRGTPLHERKAELGLVESFEIALTEIDRVQTDIPHVVASPSFTYEEWKEMSKIAESLECSIKNISKSSKENHNIFIMRIIILLTI
ncbi:1229_t:CDS:2 [Gigaspora rosea]|nr:1229_t:CDS:2 [Gigaspora rosea]